MTPLSQNDVLTVAELAAYLRVPKSTIYKLAQERCLPGLKVGRHWRFQRAAIDRWLQEQSGNSTAKVTQEI